MIRPSQVWRLVVIQQVLIRHGLDELVFSLHLFRPLQFVFYLLPWNWFRRERAPLAERILHALEDLGPIFVKFGQILSTRRDLLPDDIAEALSRLQDAVPPFPAEQAREIIERELGEEIDALFAEFRDTPLASASIAQVHAASLRDGREVVVKVVRPGIEKVIRRDIALMRILANLAERYWPDGRRLKPTGVVREFEKTILDELDLLREAANASQLRRNFREDPRLVVPEVDWNLTTTSVMVMERLHGIRIDDTEALRAAGVELHEVAMLGVDLFFTQVFRDSYFHADLHPGNLFVLPPSEEHAILRIAAVDFGIMGSLSDFDQRYLADNFLAFLDRDYRKVAELHVESGWVPAGTRVDEFEDAIRGVCEPILERPLREISFGYLLLRLFQTARRFHMEILPQLLLLQKTLINIEGLGRQLDPELDLWQAARPSMERWMKDRTGLRRLVNKSKENLPFVMERLPELPDLLLDALAAQRGAGDRHRELMNRIDGLERSRYRAARRQRQAVAGSGLLIVAAVLTGFGETVTPLLLGVPLSIWLSGGGGLLLLLRSLLD